jgi:hypothetical protein
MAEILDTAVSVFEEDGWPFTQLEGQPVLRTGFQGRNGDWTCFAQAWDEPAVFAFYSVCPVNAPDDRRPAVAEFLTRANYGMLIGNFELDWMDGEIRFKTSIRVGGDGPSPTLVKELVYTNVLMMDMYLPGILRVLCGDISPAEAIAAIEEAG